MPHGIDNTVAKTAKSCVAQVYVNQKVLHVLCYTVSMIKRPVILVILDGFGIPPATTASSSPFKAASCPTIHEMEKHYPFTTLQASGIAVGLLMGQAGNSEVGHLTMGAGRTLYHHLPRIITAIEDRSFLKNEAFLSSISHAEERKSTLHLMGLFSSGSVHAYRDHFYALIELVGGKDIPVKLHLFSDGKDSPTREFAENLQELKQYLNEEGYSNVDIASLIGRFYAMDRDAQWERIHKAYQCLIGEQALSFSNPIKYVEDSYQKGVEDEFIEPAWRMNEKGEPSGRICEHDAVIIWNFREDSMREIIRVLADEAFDGFARKMVNDLFIVTMTEYVKGLPVKVAFPPLDIIRPLAQVISEAEKTQVHIAETQKYAHVTYFFNGGIEEAFKGEDRVLVPSLKVEHFDESPQMAAPEITEIVLEEFSKHHFTLVNFANPDMVGHTGNFEATVKAVEVVDAALRRIMDKVLEVGGIMMVTGDHGNAEEKYYGLTGRKRTKHTTNVVPFFIAGEIFKRDAARSQEEIEEEYKHTKGTLADVAPTVLAAMEINQPGEMSGVNLVPKILQ